MKHLHGTVQLVKDMRVWAVECEPDVAIRIKRVLAKLREDSFGMHYLSDTPENAKDLLWFISRYPMKVTEQAYLELRAQEFDSSRAIVERLLSDKKRGKPRVFKMKLPPREYQHTAATMWLAQGSLILADDLGLGKTISAIAGLTDPKTRPALVVAQTHLLTQWREQLGKFAPQLKTHIIRSSTPYDVRRVCPGKHKVVDDPFMAGGGRCARCDMSLDDINNHRTPGPEVLIINYHKLHRWAERFHGEMKSVVFDECQELRKHEANGIPTKKYNAAKYIRETADYALGLSATPIYNEGAEFHSVAQIIRPDALGTRSEFLREWCHSELIADPKAFGRHAREIGLMLRRTRSDVKRELPEITRIQQDVDANLEELNKVSDRCAELASFLLRGTQVDKAQKLRAGEELSWRLRQATGLAKAPFVAEFVKLLLQSEKNVILFGWHRDVYTIWLKALEWYRPMLYTGSESPAQKDKAKKAFIDGYCRVLILSLRSGSGLDGLQDVCRTVAYGELDWSPGVHEQCDGRVHRDGQKDPVFSYYLTTDSGSDPVIIDALGLKRQQIEGVRDPDAELVEKLSVDPGKVKRLAEAYLAQQGISADAAKFDKPLGEFTVPLQDVPYDDALSVDTQEAPVVET